MLAWLSFSAVSFDALGGTIHASPPKAQMWRVSDGAGSWSQSLTWPVSIPSATDFWLQFLVADGSVPAGLSVSNAVGATTP